ncbi:MAG: ATP-binding protein [Rickettsiales bacterium]|nr:ATP-binding protein [Rickettsiales bacterium]
MAKYVIDKEFDDININDIEFLVDNKVAEGLLLDYKVQNYSRTNNGKKELLKDITAFANSSGGDLIIGVGDDKYNQASFISGIETNNIAEEVNRIEQIVYSGTEPKLNSFKVKYLKLDDGKYIIIVRVEASPLFPHMISFQKNNRFYIRKSDKNILLDAYELKNIFLKSENIFENIKNENKKRISRIYSGDSIIPIDGDRPKILINFIPYHSVINDKIFNFKNITLGFPIQRINFDGILGYKTNQNGISSYCQLYRNGILEFASTTSKVFSNIENPFNTIENVDVINANKNGFEDYLIRKCSYFYDVLKNLNVELPIYMFISLIDVNGYRIYYKNQDNVKLTNAVDRDLLILPEIEIKSSNFDMKSILTDIINMIWNACGEEKSVNFDS